MDHKCLQVVGRRLQQGWISRIFFSALLQLPQTMSRPVVNSDHAYITRMTPGQAQNILCGRFLKSLIYCTSKCHRYWFGGWYPHNKHWNCLQRRTSLSHKSSDAQPGSSRNVLNDLCLITCGIDRKLGFRGYGMQCLLSMSMNRHLENCKSNIIVPIYWKIATSCNGSLYSNHQNEKTGILLKTK